MVELVRVRDVIRAPVDAVWALLTDFAHPHRLSKLIEGCEVSGEGVGALRTIRARGRIMHERLLEADGESHRFRYEVLDHGDMPAPHVKSYRATVLLSSPSPEATEIEWSSEGEIDGPPGPISEEVAAIYRRGIASLKSLTADAERTADVEAP